MNLGSEQIRRELAATLPELAAVKSAAPIPKAQGYPSFLVTLEDGTRLLLKVARTPPEAARLSAVAESAALAVRHGVPAQKVYHLCEKAQHLEGLPYLVQEYFTGLKDDARDAEDAWTKLSPGDHERILRDFGWATGKLHRIPGESFTEGKVERERAADWMAHVESRAAKLEEDNRRAQVLDPSELQSGAQRILELARRSAHAIHPRLAHRDLCLRNVLIDSRGFKCLLDFEHARFTDPVFDFVRLQHLVFEPHPHTQSPFMEGYRDSHPKPWPHERERLAVAFGLEYLGAIPYHLRHNREEDLTRCLRRYRLWLQDSESI